MDYAGWYFNPGCRAVLKWPVIQSYFINQNRNPLQLAGNLHLNLFTQTDPNETGNPQAL